MAQHNTPDPLIGASALELLTRCIELEHDVSVWRDRADRWQKLTGPYDDNRYALRNCDDTPEGHAEFYNECARLLFEEE
jgi:hypothetical protein